MYFLTRPPPKKKNPKTNNPPPKKKNPTGMKMATWHITTHFVV